MYSITPQDSQPTSASHMKRNIGLGVLFVVLFASASFGGYFAYTRIFNAPENALQNPDSSYAWRPYSVSGTCSNGRVIGNRESLPYNFEFTFILAAQNRSYTFSHTWRSSVVDGSNIVDAAFAWSELDARGAEFAALLRQGDRVNWTASVTYTNSSGPQVETYTGFFLVGAGGCVTTTATASPSQTASASATLSPSPTRTASPRPSATATATSTASPSATQTASPSPTEVALISTSPTANPTATPQPTNQTTNPPSTSSPTDNTAVASTNATEPPKSVSGVNSNKLPEAGVPVLPILFALGSLSLVLSLFFNYIKNDYRD